MSSKQEAIDFTENYYSVKRKIDNLSGSERELLKREIKLNYGSELTGSNITEGQLTYRERQVLTLIAAGYTRKQVGNELNISYNTASCHVAHIYSKLQISTVVEATHAAMRFGLLTN